MEIRFLDCWGLIFGPVRPNLTILKRVLSFLSYILEMVGDRGLGMVSKALKLNFMIEMSPLEAWKLCFWTVWAHFWPSQAKFDHSK